VKDGDAVYIPVYDQNGNVTGYADAQGGQVASYAYDAFGKTVQASGVAAEALKFRYSTKYADDESGLVYYGYRYYAPSLGRFMSRDPQEERAGGNLYAFCANDPVSCYDLLGMLTAGEAAWHYLFGPDDPNDNTRRVAKQMSFDEINTSTVHPSDFPKVKEALRNCKKGSYPVGKAGQYDILPFQTQGTLALALGVITLQLEGRVRIAQNGDWFFAGKLSSHEDTYDFNPSKHRGRIAEGMTTVGRHLPGKVYTIKILGTKSLSEEGNCCSYNNSRQRTWWQFWK